ncbi:Do family serine endopeptidase [Allosphingosinicella vermicomposti]|uniref:Do family serine endopeptidase n=1 Tax=Allosphingosinicella vermicomposti TaxID=614671 RepID=UPI000D0F07B9|nr:Do family serine endopeptidase [Allosphingosinicella vermicomposti]
MRYVYGFTAAVLLGGAAATLTINPTNAQTAQNEGPIAATAPRPGAPMSFADLTARLAPAVVNISTRQSIEVRRNQQLPPGFEEFFRQFGGQVPNNGGEDNTVTQRGGSLGSGFLISADGYIVTNNHVVSPARSNATVDEIIVTLSDRREFAAELVGRDQASDLALLKIKSNDLPFVRFGDSTQTRVGDWVVAIGNPFGLGGTVTAGIVSAVHRNLEAGLYDRYIQTDASINVGNSGGPMFDLNGNVIGINTALISPTGGNVGLGFAIPAEQARPIIESLQKGQRVQRGYIGVGLQRLDDGIAESLGIEKNRGELIRSVTESGPAARAGIRQGDVVITVNNRPVTPEDSLAYIVANTPVGSRIPVEFIRDGRRQTVQVQVGERPTDEELRRLSGVEEEQELTEPPASQQSDSQKAAREGLGVTVQTLTPEVARSLRLNDVNLKGVVIAEVNASSDAAAKGVRRGDIILSINQRPTRTPEEAAAIVQAARSANRKSVLLLIRRGNTPPIYVGVELSSR